MSTTNNRVFVSHCKEDRAAAERIVATLRGFGLDVWVDFDSIKPGFIWRDEIRDGIVRSDCFVLIVSNAYLNSDFCKDEFETLKIFRFNRIIPILIDDCREALTADSRHSILGEYVTVDFYRGEYGGADVQRDTLLDRVADALRLPLHGDRESDPVDFFICGLHKDEKFANLLADGIRALGFSAATISDKGSAGDNIPQMMYHYLSHSTSCVFILSADAIVASSTVRNFALASEEMRLPLLAVATPELSGDTAALEKGAANIAAIDHILARIAERQIFLSNRDIAEVCEDVVAAVADRPPAEHGRRYLSDDPRPRLRDVLHDLQSLFGRAPR